MISTDKPTFTAIIQARMDSTRLPGKAMLELAGKPIIAHVIEICKSIPGVNNVVLATSRGDENRQLVDIASSLGAGTYMGSIDNVLERYFMASEKYPCDYIVRVTGDNPFTDPFYAGETVKMAGDSGADLCSFLNLPMGTAVEIIKKSALEEAYKSAAEPHQFEHVSPYIKENPSIFRVVRKNAIYDNPFGNVRLTIDTPEDYELASAIYRDIYHGKPLAMTDVIDYLKKHPHLVEINSTIVQRPMTHTGKDE